MLLEAYLSFEIGKYFCKKTWAILFISSFFRWALEYPLFYISRTLVHFFNIFLFFLLFMNNFCIASCFFWLQQNFWEIATRTWSIYLVDILLRIFLVFSPSVGVKDFWVDLDGMAYFCTYPSIEVVHMWVVCTWYWF